MMCMDIKIRAFLVLFRWFSLPNTSAVYETSKTEKANKPIFFAERRVTYELFDL